MHVRLPIITAFFAVQTATAGPVELELAWRSWMKDHSSTASTLAIIQDGELIAEWGHIVEPGAVFPLASLSKAITGACIMSLVDEGLLTTQTRLAAIFADRPDILRPGKTPAAQITIAQLLTHTSGLLYDRTQNINHPAWLGRMDGHDALAGQSLTQSLGRDEFYYNNENFSILGAVIQHITGETVQDACTPRVLYDAPTAGPSDLFGSTLSYAGWAMSAGDYARFADRLEVANNWPVISVEYDYFYGPGVDVERWSDGDYVSHSGNYCIPQSTAQGSFFAKYPNGITFVVIHDLCLDVDDYWEMYDLLQQAALR